MNGRPARFTCAAPLASISGTLSLNCSTTWPGVSGGADSDNSADTFDPSRSNNGRGTAQRVANHQADRPATFRHPFGGSDQVSNIRGKSTGREIARRLTQSGEIEAQYADPLLCQTARHAARGEALLRACKTMCKHSPGPGSAVGRFDHPG